MPSQLQELQQRMAACVMQPLTRQEGMRRRRTAGGSTEREAAAFIRPNSRLTSFERLEIYNRQYWFRLFSSFQEDFPGLQSVVGKKRFQGLMLAYLEECPSTSFTLRNLGSRLSEWLKENPQWTEPRSELANEMAALEWAHIEAYDGAVWPRWTPDAVQSIGAESRITLQPYLRLIEAHSAIDDALIAVRSGNGSSDGSSNNASTGHVARRLRAIRRMKREHLYILVHRFEDTVYYRRVESEDYRILQALQQGKTLAEALEAGLEGSTLLDREWANRIHDAFQYWAAMGWFCTPPLEIEEEEAR